MLRYVEFQRFKAFRQRRIEIIGGTTLAAGGNNSGKTSLFQGLAVWEFCKILVEAEKGEIALTPGQSFQGVGIGQAEFLPMNLPDLRHLWTNLKPQRTPADANGYTLRIRCGWSDGGADKHLEFGLALANDRLFVKTTASNLAVGDRVPRIAYLPPFAGISSREMRLPRALRRRRIGEGLAGSVIRNSLLDLHSRNEAERRRLRADKPKISDPDLRHLRATDPWEMVQQSLRQVFGAELAVSPFNEAYHSYIDVRILKGTAKGHKLTKFPDYRTRDLMVEGSGLLQWLSVFSLAVDPDVDVLLLDEPDAHLHPTLQREMFSRLSKVSESKTVLIATHSPEVLRWTPFDRILGFRNGEAPRYLQDELSKVGMVAGIGSIYMPRFDAARLSGRVLFVEGDGDAAVLKRAAEVQAQGWNDAWVVWPEKSGHPDRVRLAGMMSREIPGLRALSLRDRDLASPNSVGPDLVCQGLVHPPECVPLTWKRRNVESYLIWPSAIAAAANMDEAQVRQILTDDFGIAVGENFRLHQAPAALIDADGKRILQRFGLIWKDLLPHMTADWLPEDLVTVLRHLN